MAGRTGYTPTPAAFDPQVHMDAIQAFFDALIGESYANAAALPSTGNWVGRLVETADTRILWLCTSAVGSGTWIPVSGAFPAETRRRTSTFAVGLSFVVLDFDTQIDVVNDALLDYAAGVFTAKLAGRWRFRATMMANNAVNSYFNARLLKNGSTVMKQVGGMTSTTANTSHHLEWEGVLAVNDTMQFHQSGGSTSIVGQYIDGAGNWTTDVVAEYMGPA